MLTDLLRWLIQAQDRNINREIVYLLWEDVTIRARIGFDTMAEWFPMSARRLPNYRLLRQYGLYIGGGAGLALLFLVFVAGLTVSPLAITFGMVPAVLSVPVFALLGWMYAPSFPFHEYRPYWIIRCPVAYDGSPEAAHYAETVPAELSIPVTGGKRYFLPWRYSSQIPIRASRLYQDGLMLDEKDSFSAPGNKWRKIQVGSLLVLAGIMAFALFMLVAVRQ
jgi:hypothetical protein